MESPGRICSQSPLKAALRFSHATSDAETIGASPGVSRGSSWSELEEIRSQLRAGQIPKWLASSSRDRRADHIAVMLHLRARYVSKAAILTMLIRSYRSKIEVPLEFQGLGSLGAASWRRFFPCEFDSNKEQGLWLQKIRLFRECLVVTRRPCSSWPAMKEPSTRSKPISINSMPC
jgi:hypothetical protein